MDVVLWVLQIVLAVAVLLAGTLKLTRSQEQLEPQMPWVRDFGPDAVRLIGLAEVLGGLGLVLPAALDVAPILTPVAAAGVAVVMVGAVVVHIRRHEGPALPPAIVLLVLALVIAWGRFGPYSF